MSFQNLCNPLSCVLGFSKKLKIMKIWQLKVDQNKDLVCYKKSSHSDIVPENSESFYKSPVLNPKEGLWVYRKTENVNSLRPTLFELCKKNCRWGGTNCLPPPSRIGLQKEKSIIHNYIFNKSFLAVYCFEIQPNQRMPFMFIFKGPLLSSTN